MTKEQCIKYFGSASTLARNVGITKSAISNWGEYPPFGRQLLIEKITRYSLKAEKNIPVHGNKKLSMRGRIA